MGGRLLERQACREGPDAADVSGAANRDGNAGFIVEGFNAVGVAPWPLSSMTMPRWNRSSVKGALSSCGVFLAIVQAKHQPEAGVALKPP